MEGLGGDDHPVRDGVIVGRCGCRERYRSEGSHLSISADSLHCAVKGRCPQQWREANGTPVRVDQRMAGVMGHAGWFSLLVGVERCAAGRRSGAGRSLAKVSLPPFGRSQEGRGGCLRTGSFGSWPGRRSRSAGGASQVLGKSRQGRGGVGWGAEPPAPPAAPKFFTAREENSLTWERAERAVLSNL